MIRIAIVLIVFCTSGCVGNFSHRSSDNEEIVGSRNIVTERRELGEFNGVVVDLINVILVASDTQFVEVEADDNVLPFVITEVKEGNLRITYVSGPAFINTQVTVKVGIKNISNIVVGGSGEVRSEAAIFGEKIGVELSGSGNMDLELDAPEVSVKVTGSGSITLNGQSHTINCEVLGSGAIMAKDLKAEIAKVSVFGSSDVSVYASDSIHATVGGSGNVYYTGGGTVTSNVMGSGSVLPLE